LFTHILMLLVSPGPISRYVFGSIILGITIFVGISLVLVEKRTEFLDNFSKADIAN